MRTRDVDNLVNTKSELRRVFARMVSLGHLGIASNILNAVSQIDLATDKCIKRLDKSLRSRYNSNQAQIST